MKLSLVGALLLLAVFSFQQSPASKTKEAEATPKLLDVRINAVMNLNYMIRKYASSKAELPANIDHFKEAVAVARQLNTEFGGWVGAGWATLDAALAKSRNGSEAIQALSQVPETATSRQGKTIPVRDAAIRYGKALSAVESSYLKNLWPEHQILAEQTAARIAKTFGPKEQECFAYLTKSLGIADAQYSVPVFLAAETPWPGGFTFWTGNRKGIVVVSIETNPGSMLFETLMHETIHALDLETAGNGNVLEDIRTRLKKAGIAENDIAATQGTHMLVFIQAGETVRRLVDSSHQHYGDVRRVYENPALQPLVKVARPVWMAYLDQKITREDAISQIVEGYIRVRKEAAMDGRPH
jgi:hypothetical protein